MPLDDADIERIAQRVAELLRDRLPEPANPAGPVRLVDAATLARTLGVRRDWVYAHAKDLGAVRLGGPHGRLRFATSTRHSEPAPVRRNPPVRRRRRSRHAVIDSHPAHDGQAGDDWPEVAGRFDVVARSPRAADQS